MTTINDIVLIYFEDKPFCFARIEDINADIKRDWYHVKLLFLQIPIQTGVWILREEYIEGAEFTMNGKRMRLEKIESPVEDDQQEEEQEEGKNNLSNAKVISFADRKKNKNK